MNRTSIPAERRAACPARVTARKAGVAIGVLFALLMSSSGRSQAPVAPVGASFTPDEVLVRFIDQPPDEEIVGRLSAFGMVVVKKLDLVEGLYLVKLPTGMSVAEGRVAVARLAGVVYAEPNYLLFSTVLPNDPSFAELWGLHNTGQSGGTSDADIDAPEAWNITTGSADVVVAVIDTGVDYAHQDLAPNMFQNTADCNSNGVDDDANGFVDDCYGIDTANNDSNPMDDNNHGTHVSGTIGAVGNNGLGVVGVNWNVRIMACKFLGASGSGTTSDAIDCLNYVKVMRDRGFNIVATNNSWGGGGYSQALYDAIDVQRQRGILFIAAAGNSASDNDTTPDYPSSYDLPNVIAVAATTRTDARSSFSSYGRHTVHLGAPGSAVLSTTRNNTYSTLSGTSMATPHVAGVAALLEAQDPNRDWRAIKNLILAGAEAVPAMTSTITQRRLNAAGALSCSNVVVQSRLRPILNTVGGAPGEAVTLRALHISCANPAGNVAVTVSPGGQTVTLLDNGAAPDQAAGDGIYAGSFVPASGSYALTFPGGDVVTVEVGNASYNSSLKAPACGLTVGACSASSLLNGRDNMAGGAEPNQPNTINASCADGTAGSYHIDESIDGLKISTPDGSLLRAGQTARIEALVYVWGTTADRLDLYYTSTATTPSWQYLTTLAATSTGAQRLSANYTLPEGPLQAIRANFRYSGSAGPCTGGSFDDHDDLIFSVVSNFTDVPLSGGVTTIRAVHISELRGRIDAQRVRYGLSAFAWTDAPLIAGMTVKTVHLTELRTALQEAYAAAKRPTPAFTDPTIVAGSTLIRAAHVTELRDAVVALEGS